MANITPRYNKDGEITSYLIRVFKGRDSSGKQLKPYSMSWKPEKGMTPKQTEKALQKQAVLFEKQCKDGLMCDNKQTFEEYASYVLKLKERSGVKHTTITCYQDLLKRINQGIGHLKVVDIRPHHLNKLYEQLAKENIRGKKAIVIAKSGLKQVITSKGYTMEQLCNLSGVSINTLRTAFTHTVSLSTAEKISKALKLNVNTLFDVTSNSKPLSNKTILEHHRLISSIFAQAEKEMIILYNPASRATPPKAENKEANYFNIEDIEQIRDCLETEPIKWRTLTHLLLVTGCRRGELLGLKWASVDFDKQQIHICNNLLYRKDRGLYEDTPKTESSNRWVKLPAETMVLLRQYKIWQSEEALKMGGKWHNNGFVFTQANGKPMHPDSITSWLSRFSERHNLPHINPHAFRHTMASVLYFNGMDSISISKRLGHSKVSTTTDIYAHIMKQADEQAAECIANALLRPAHKQAK